MKVDERIYNAMLQLLANGERMSVRAVVRASGVSVNSLYRRLNSKKVVK